MIPRNKKTKLLTIALVIVLILFLTLAFWPFYPFNCDKLPPKTPLKIARYTSGLDIPDDVDVVHFERSEQTIGGDYSDEIVIQLSEEQTKKLQQEWDEKGYGNESLPKADPMFSTGVKDYFAENIQPSDQGLFRRIENKSYVATIALNITRNRLIISDSSD